MYTIFMLLNATKYWLTLSRPEREQFVETELQPILAAHSGTSLTFYDAEAFSGRCSDVAVFDTDVLEDYMALIDALRDSKMYTVPYFEVVEIIPAHKADFV